MYHIYNRKNEFNVQNLITCQKIKLLNISNIFHLTNFPQLRSSIFSLSIL